MGLEMQFRRALVKEMARRYQGRREKIKAHLVEEFVALRG